MCITTTSAIKDEPPNEFALADLLEDEYIMFVLQLKHTYSSQSEPPFLSGSHNFGVVGTTTYAYWYSKYMDMLHDWQNDPSKFASE